MSDASDGSAREQAKRIADGLQRVRDGKPEAALALGTVLAAWMTTGVPWVVAAEPIVTWLLERANNKAGKDAAARVADDVILDDERRELVLEVAQELEAALGRSEARTEVARAADAERSIEETRRAADELLARLTILLHRMEERLADAHEATAAATRPIAPIPALPDGRSFVGRAQDLAWLQAVLTELPAEGSTSRVCVIFGMAGVGKSRLIDVFLRQHGPAFPGGRVHVRIESGRLLTRDGVADAIADRIGGSAGPKFAESVRAAHVLVHVDNVDSRAAAEIASHAVAMLPGCAIVITGRFEFGVDAGWPTRELRPFGVEDALDFLRTAWRSPANEEEESEARQLITDVGGLPLALNLAAAYLRKGATLRGFRQRLFESGLALSPRDPAEAVSEPEAARRVIAASVRLSLEGFSNDVLDPRVAQALRDVAAAFTCPFGRLLAAATSGLPVADSETATMTATEFGLLERADIGDHVLYEFHPLVRVLIQSGASNDAAARRDAWFVDRLGAATPPGVASPAEPPEWAELVTELPALHRWIAGLSGAEVLELGPPAFRFACVRGPHAAWRSALERAQLLAPPGGIRYWVNRTLAVVAAQARDYPTALAAALAWQLESVALDLLPAAAEAAACRAGTLGYMGRHSDAADVLRNEALPILRACGDEKQLAQTLIGLANNTTWGGDAEGGIRVYMEEALEIVERVNDPSLNFLFWQGVATTYIEGGRADDGLDLIERRVLPLCLTSHNKVLTLSIAANAWARKGDLDRAIAMWESQVLPAWVSVGDTSGLFDAMERTSRLLIDRGTASDLRGAIRYLDVVLRAAAEQGTDGGNAARLLFEARRALATATSGGPPAAAG